MISNILSLIITLLLGIIRFAVKIVRRIVADIVFITVYLYNVFKYQEKPVKHIWEDIREYKMKEFFIISFCVFLAIFFGLQHYADIPSVDTPYNKVETVVNTISDNIYVATNKISFHADKEVKWMKEHPTTMEIYNSIFSSNRHKRRALHRNALREKMIAESLNH